MEIFKERMSLADAIATRQSIRSYAPGRVDRSTINALLSAAVRAPNAMHEEQWEFVIVQGRSVLKRLSELAKTSMSELENERHVLLTPSLQKFNSPDFNVFYDAETLIVICGKSNAPFVPADCWLAAENLMLSACALGLGTCVIGSALLGLNSRKGKAMLAIPADTQAVVPIIIGIPNGKIPVMRRSDPVVLNWLEE
jgi:nitroreductase